MDRVDENDEVIGRVPRAHAYALHANFRVVHVFVLNRQDQLLIHQLASGKRTHPGAWGSSVAGGVRAGETPEAAARREVEEELGLACPRVRFIGKTAVREMGLTKFLYLYMLKHDGPVFPDPAEVALVEFVDLPRLKEMVRHRERDFTPTFQSALDLFEGGTPA